MAGESSPRVLFCTSDFRHSKPPKYQPVRHCFYPPVWCSTPYMVSSLERVAAVCFWDWSAHSFLVAVTSCGDLLRGINWPITRFLDESVTGQVVMEEARLMATVGHKLRMMPFLHKPIRLFSHSCHLLYRRFGDFLCKWREILAKYCCNHGIYMFQFIKSVLFCFLKTYTFNNRNIVCLN